MAPKTNSIASTLTSCDRIWPKCELVRGQSPQYPDSRCKLDSFRRCRFRSWTGAGSRLTERTKVPKEVFVNEAMASSTDLAKTRSGGGSVASPVPLFLPIGLLMII